MNIKHAHIFSLFMFPLINRGKENKDFLPIIFPFLISACIMSHLNHNAEEQEQRSLENKSCTRGSQAVMKNHNSSLAC